MDLRHYNPARVVMRHPFVAVCPAAPPDYVPPEHPGQPEFDQGGLLRSLPASLPPGGPPFATWVRRPLGYDMDRVVEAGCSPKGVRHLVARGVYEGVMLPGRVDQYCHVAYVNWAGQERYTPQFEVLVVGRGNVEWLPASDGDIPANALPISTMPNGETAYCARANLNGEMIPGRLTESKGACVIGNIAQELVFDKYEVLAIL